MPHDLVYFVQQIINKDTLSRIKLLLKTFALLTESCDNPTTKLDLR